MTNTNYEILIRFIFGLFLWGPIFFGPPGYLFLKLFRGIKNRNINKLIDEKEKRTKNIISYSIILFVIFCYSLAAALFIFEKIPFWVLLPFLIFVVPIILVVFSLLAGLGKAFEAGLSSTTLLSALNSMWEETRKNN